MDSEDEIKQTKVKTLKGAENFTQWRISITAALVGKDLIVYLDSDRPAPSTPSEIKADKKGKAKALSESSPRPSPTISPLGNTSPPLHHSRLKHTNYPSLPPKTYELPVTSRLTAQPHELRPYFTTRSETRDDHGFHGTTMAFTGQPCRKN